MRSVHRRSSPVAERFGNVNACHALRARKIGKRAGDAEDTVVAARGEAHGFGGLHKELPARVIGRGGVFEQFAVRFRIGADTVRFIAGGLQCAGSGDARGDFGRAFGGRRQREIGGGNGFDLDVQVDAVEERPGELGLIIRRAARRAGAGERGVAEVPAAAWVHRGDQLHARGVGDMKRGARDADFAGFERLTQRIECLALELRQFIEEQHAEMREADLTGPRLRAAADKRRH